MRRPVIRRTTVLFGLAGTALLATLPAVVPSAATNALAASKTPGVQLPSGRLVTPAGSPYDGLRAHGDASYDLGDFPEGLALSPDGRLAVASLNGRGMGQPHGFNSFCEQDQTKPGYTCPGVPQRLTENPGTTAPDEGLDVVDLQTGRVKQVVAVPTSNSLTGHTTCNQGYNCFGFGLTFSPDGRHVYASGGGDDSVYDFAVAGARLTLAHTTPIPSPATSVPADPVSGGAKGYPRAVAVTPNGKTLVVVNEFDSTIEALDVTGGKAPTLLAQALLPGAVPGQAPVAYLYGVALSADGAQAYVTAEGSGLLYVVNVAALVASGELTSPAAALGKSLAAAVATALPLTGVNHPTGLAVAPNGSELLVAGADSDNVAVVPLSGGMPTGAVMTVPLSVVLSRSATELGSTPNAVAFSGDGRRAYVALAGDDADAVLDTTSPTPTVLGYLPTGWYPTDVKVGPKDGCVYTVSAKGLGSRYVKGIGGYTPAPGTQLPRGASLPGSDYYDAENMPGLLTRVRPPSTETLTAYTGIAQLDILHAGGLDQRPAQSPIPAAIGEPSPIKHVVYIVRENRTFDQVFGDLALKRKDVDADAYDQVLASATPNAHEVAGRYAIADHFFSDGEASVQGHWWTSSAAANDYIEKSWRQYYSPRGRPGDSAILPVTTPPGCSIFQKLQAYKKSHPGFTFENYGELVGLVMPNSSVGTPAANLCNGLGPAGPGSNSLSDPNYPTQAELTPDDRTRAKEFLLHSGLNLDGSAAGNGKSLRNFNYLILSEDHTSGFAGTYTPRSQVAQNDAGLGQIIAGLSRSKYWSSTAVFVQEDDSQDGADHVDGHRNVLLVASPYAKQVSADGCLPGYIAHPHYDQASILRTVELILGLTPLSAYDAGATPLYDMFQPIGSARQLTAADLRPFAVATAPPFIDETVASVPPSSSKQALIAYSNTLDTRRLDVSEAGLENVLWQSVRSDPVPEQLAEEAAEAPGRVAAGPVAVSQGQTAGAQLDAQDGLSDLEPVEVRPGTPPALSTATGLPIDTAGTADCSNVVVPMTLPVPPGATTLDFHGQVLSAAVVRPALAETGLRRLWPAWLGAGLVLLAFAVRAARRDAVHVDGRA
jgi:DNA-binding beta-propeller fold protein YncE